MWRHFTSAGFRNLIGRSSAELDLRDAEATNRFLAAERPEVIIDAAATVGGISANASRPATFISDNLRIQTNLLDGAVAHGVERFLFLGSSCIYPKVTTQPIREEALLTGALEPTNEAYALAKLAGIAQVKAIRRQYGLPYISAMPTSQYGPGDNFDPHDAHVVPALIRRFHNAVQDNAPRVTCWGSGRPRRELMYVDDLAAACRFLLDTYDDELTINVGTGEDVSIAELASTIAAVTGYRGDICWDTDKPDGTYQKLLDVERLDALGWTARVPITDGIRATYAWFLQNHDTRRAGSRGSA